MRSLAPCILVMLAVASISVAPAAPTNAIGPVRVQPVLTLYVISNGQPCDVTVTYQDSGRHHHFQNEQMLTRVFDPAEELTDWQYDEVRDLSKLPVVHKTRLAGAKGVHQVRLIAGMKNVEAHIEFSRPLAYGITGQCGVFNPWDPKMKGAWVWVPPNGKTIEVHGGPLVVADASGKAILETKGAKGKAKKNLTSTRAVLKVSFPNPADWSFRMRGFPFILCDSADTARAIQASVIETPGGQIVYHQFQADILAMLPRILKPENAGSTDELIKPLDANLDAWLEDPIRNRALLGSWAPMEHIPWMLRNQVIDPTSPISGGVIDPSKKLKKGQLPSAKSIGTCLGFAATLDKPFNPYRGRKELAWRAAAVAMRDLMRLGEDETFQKDSTGNLNDYPTGILYFPLAHSHSGAFKYAAPLLPDDVRELWAKGLRHPIDRMFPIGLVTCRNQSSHGMMILQEYYEGSGDKTYEKMARLFADRFVRGMNGDAYDMERCGPDASYQGMTDWHKGYYYCMTGHEGMRESLIKSYTFYDHTVAPEPDGTVLGSVNFSHRTAVSFAHEQYSGARGMCAQVSPVIGIWTPPRTEKTREDAIEYIKRRFETPFTRKDYQTGSPRVAGRYAGRLTIPRYIWYTDKPAVGVFPAQEKEPFVRDLAGELIAVKRPTYYAAAYVGKPAGEYYVRTRHAFRKPMPDGGEEADKRVGKYNVTPFSGGGLSVFWTPEYGNALLGANWTPRVHHGLIVRMPDGRRWWEDYLNHTYALDADAGVLTVTGVIEEQPIEYRRVMRFGDDALTMEVTLTASKDVAASGIVEIIPFVFGDRKANGVLLNVPERGKEFTIHDRKGNGVRYSFNGEYAFKPVRAMYHAKYEHRTGRIEVALPAKLKAGQPVKFAYEIRPVSGATGGKE